MTFALSGPQWAPSNDDRSGKWKLVLQEQSQNLKRGSSLNDEQGKQFIGIQFQPLFNKENMVKLATGKSGEVTREYVYICNYVILRPHMYGKWENALQVTVQASTSSYS